jgi:hypothetical protein
VDKPKKPSKLKTLRPWLTVPEAARYLGLTFKDEVTEAEVLRFALDGELKLSVRFVNPTLASLYGPVHEAQQKELAQIRAARAAGTALPPMKKRRPKEDYFVLRDGPWDLPMTGHERRDVERRWQKLDGGRAVPPDPVYAVYLDARTKSTYVDPPVDDSFDGTFVDGDDGARYRLFRKEVQAISADPKTEPRASYYYILLTRLPEDSVLVLRKESLDQFVERVSGTSIDRELKERERRVLLTIVWLLFRDSTFYSADLSAAGDAIDKQSELLGRRVARHTILDHLKRAKDLFA